MSSRSGPPQDRRRHNNNGRGNRRRGDGHYNGNNRDSGNRYHYNRSRDQDDTYFDENDANNDLTFGFDAKNLEGEFDFSTSQVDFEKEKHAMNNFPPGLPRPYVQHGNSEPQWSAYPPQHHHYGNELGYNTNNNYVFDHMNPGNSGLRMLSLEEVEAQLRNNLYIQEQEAIQYQPEEIDWEQVRLERKQARELRNEKMKEYKGMMIQSDKNFITRIQLSQLVTSSQSLTLEDYYYRTFMTSNMGSGNDSDKPGSTDRTTNNPRGRNKENQIARMQRQITKIVAESRRRQLTYPVGLENALGKITSKSTRNPKQVLQILQQKPNGEEGEQPTAESTFVPQPAKNESIRNRIPGLGNYVQTPREKKRTIKLIEDLYDITLEAEYLSNNRPPVQIETEEDQERADEWRQAFEKTSNQLWSMLAISEDKDPRSLIHLVNITKGKKLISRMLRFLSPDQTLNFITALLSGLEETNVCKNGVCPPKGQLAPAILEEVELFLTTICPPILNYVNEAPLIIINGLLGLLIEKNNVAWISRSKVGLAFLTLFLTRIETLRQSGGSMVGFMAPSPEIPLSQSAELYMNLFSNLQNHFLAIFPPTNSHIEDVYVWQFLAALAVGLNVTQQHQLVVEVREKVLENVTNASRSNIPLDVAQARIANVNLFLHALGLDASQVNVSSTPR